MSDLLWFGAGAAAGSVLGALAFAWGIRAYVRSTVRWLFAAEEVAFGFDHAPDELAEFRDYEVSKWCTVLRAGDGKPMALFSHETREEAESSAASLRERVLREFQARGLA